MRKNDMIKMLSEIEGNPEVMFWNGAVGDCVPIDTITVPVNLYKETLQYYLEMCRLSECRDRQDWTYELTPEDIQELTQNYRGFSYEINEYVTTEDVQKKKYNRKTVHVLNARIVGRTSWGRGGDIDY